MSITAHPFNQAGLGDLLMIEWGSARADERKGQLRLPFSFAPDQQRGSCTERWLAFAAGK
ncbi:hypothetical protein [Pseudomonas aeruginosa]|uniref:hypothetical protein n=1 Tax=Pseudomonas aeruginosa TaxID=287 RepID=UPI002952FBBA|nr:hypothetical protein [Pseudomonas aeruginosa]MDV7945308.1 hypothetical protein [Pseudomonas aeruginosa]